MPEQLNSLIVRIGADITEYVDGLAQAARQLDGMAAKMEAAGARMTALLTVPLAGLGTAALDAAGKMQQNQIAFTTMLGSAEAAREMLSQLSDFAAKTPFEMADTVTGARRLMAFGFAAKDVIPTLTAIGDAVAAMGGGKDELDRVVLAIGQMQAKGHLATQEMNQLTEAGIPAWELLAKTIGTSVPEAMKAVEDRTISAATGINAILTGVEQKFGGMMDKQSQTMLGQWSNFKDQVTRTLIEIGNTLVPVAQSILGAMTPFLNIAVNLAREFAQLPVPIQQTAIAIGVLVAGIGPALLAGGAMMRTVAAIGSMVSALGGAAAILTPIGYAVAAIAVAWGAWELGKWLSQFTPVKAALDGLGNILLSLAKISLGTISVITGAAIKVGEVLWKVGSSIASGLMGIFGPSLRAIAYFIGNVFEKLGEFFAWISRITGADAVFNRITSSVKGAWTAVTQATTGFFDLSKASGQLALNLGQAGTALEGTTKKAHDSAYAHGHLFRTMLDVQMALKAARDAAEAAAVSWDLFTSSVARGDLVAELEGVNAEMTRLESDGGGAVNYLKVKFDEIGVVVQATKGWLNDLADAFKTLGVTSSQSLQDASEKAIRAYETIRNSGIATAHDILASWIAMEEAKVAAARAAGREVLAADQIALDEAKAKLDKMDGKAPQIESVTKAASKGMQAVSTVITDLSRGITDAIFKAQSLGQVFIKISHDIATAILRTIIERGIHAMIGSIADMFGKWATGLAVKTTATVAATAKETASVVTGFTVQRIAAAHLAVAEIAGSAAAAGAAAAAASAALFWWNPAAAVGIGIAMAGAIGSAFTPMAALASFDKGGYIPNDMVAMVHKGEYVTTAANVSAGRFGPYGEASGSGVVFKDCTFNGVTQSLVDDMMSRAVKRVRRVGGNL